MTLYRLGENSPKVPENNRFWIAPSAQVIGNVELCEDASIWFNVVVRGDNEAIVIGARSNIQDGAVLHSDTGVPLTIGSDVTIGHKVMLHGCAIGDNSLVGMNATVLNRAVIGKNSIVGAGALVPEGKVYPDGVLLIGAPARVARELTEAQYHMLKVGAAHYVENWQRFARDLTALPDV